MVPARRPLLRRVLKVASGRSTAALTNLSTTALFTGSDRRRHLRIDSVAPTVERGVC
jgi:hypothetical protein